MNLPAPAGYEARRGPPGPGRAAPRLALRFGARLVAGSALVLLLGGYWSLRLERAHLTALVSASADRIAETIRRSTRDAMLRNDAEGLRRTIDNIGAQRGLVRIRVFNKEGRIRTSTDAREVGCLVDIRAEQCYGCHQQGRPLVALERRDRVRLFEDAGGARVLGIIAPIHNEPACAGACHVHPASQRVLGVLDVQLSLEGVDEAVAASQRAGALGLSLTVAAMALLSGLLLWRMVLRPLRRFSLAMAAVGAGDLEARVDAFPPDELGELARAWNRMTEELRRARGELQDWNRRLETRVAEKTAEVERAHARLMVVEKMASLGKLAAVVAHELNNPLAGIRTFAKLLLRRLGAASPDPAAAEAETRHMLEMVEAESARCGDVVRNLLAFSREAPTRFARADLGPPALRCVALLHHRAELLGVTLEAQVPERLPAVECDAAQVEQVMLALALNAVEATPAGGSVSLRLSASDADPELEGADGLLIEVADTGCGIPEELRARVFEPFFTTKEEGKGVGLGLAVAYGIVARHGGRLTFDSRVGEGTLFQVRLPRARAPEGRAAEGGGA